MLRFLFGLVVGWFASLYCVYEVNTPSVTTLQCIKHFIGNSSDETQPR